MNRIRIRLRVTGIVQGVGFRPFIHRLITIYGLTGQIRNTSAGVEGEIQGEQEAVEQFLSALKKEKPRLAYIETVEKVSIPIKEEEAGFRIEESQFLEEATALISPDIAICPDCLRELKDPKNRRYRYPFINCTNCGPRFTIIKKVPYDREQTTMAPFAMCPDCGREYAEIEDRRYHAQPNCCEVCGPELSYIDMTEPAEPWDLNLNFQRETQPVEVRIGIDPTEVVPKNNKTQVDEPIRLAVKALKAGKILAIKGLGGFHLACRCDDPVLAMELRYRKHRDEKPFAIMCADVEAAERFCNISDAERELLQGYERPIVLLEKKDSRRMKHISENHRIGVMLPYTPIHELLFDEELRSLIMTSANFSDCPILYKDEEATEYLKGIADGILLSNREIQTRCDDSLLWEVEGNAYFARRSRGYAPFPIINPGKGRKILACGAEQKATFSLSKGKYWFPAQHIGDLKNAEAFENYREQIEHFEKLFDIQPEMIACDLHPDYLSTEYAEERAIKEGLPLVKIQHHFAHMASCMADNRLTGPCIGVIWDGTGYGTDGTSWGGEFLTGDYTGFTIQGTI